MCAGLTPANSTEFDPATPDRVIYKLRELKGVDELGGTMRLGAYPCLLAENSFARRAYGKARNQRTSSPSLRVQPRIRSGAEAARPAADGRNARRRLRRDLRTGRSSLVPGLPVSSRVQVQAARAASSVPGVYRRGAGAPRAQGANAPGDKRPRVRIGSTCDHALRSVRDWRAARADRRAVRDRERRARPLPGREIAENRRAPSSSKLLSIRPTGRA